eukprot:15005860-Ditylum_brightwellii.AAC.1
MECALKENEGHVLAVIATLLCFDLWIPDQTYEVGKLYMKEEVYYRINYLYGMQFKKMCTLINSACTVGRVYAIVCSRNKKSKFQLIG